MNCKPGDLAVIVLCPIGTEHLLGRIIRLSTRAENTDFRSVRLPHVDPSVRWNYVGERLRSSSGHVIECVNDCCLRPIRDNDGEDEMLRIAGKPREKVEG